MPQVWSGHRQRSCGARRTGHEPRQGCGGAVERQEGWLAQRQAEEENARMNLEQPFFLLHDRMNISSPRRFDALADRYASSEVHTSSPTLNRLHELLPQVESVCDVASGAGHTGLGFAGIAWRIVAVDPAPGMLAHPPVRPGNREDRRHHGRPGRHPLEPDRPRRSRH